MSFAAVLAAAAAKAAEENGSNAGALSRVAALASGQSPNRGDSSKWGKVNSPMSEEKRQELAKRWMAKRQEALAASPNKGKSFMGLNPEAVFAAAGISPKLDQKKSQRDIAAMASRLYDSLTASQISYQKTVSPPKDRPTPDVAAAAAAAGSPTTTSTTTTTGEVKKWFLQRGQGKGAGARGRSRSRSRSRSRTRSGSEPRSRTVVPGSSMGPSAAWNTPRGDRAKSYNHNPRKAWVPNGTSTGSPGPLRGTAWDLLPNHLDASALESGASIERVLSPDPPPRRRRNNVDDMDGGMGGMVSPGDS